MDQFFRQRDLNQTEILGDLMIYHYENDSSHLRHLVYYFIIEIINLFFKCLDKFGRDASPLLEFIDFNDDKTDLMNILTTKYSNVIDFTFLNMSTIPFLHQYQAKYNEVQKDIATLKELFISKNEAMQKEIDELRKKQIDDGKTIDDLMKLNDELKREISNFKSSQNECFGIGDVILSSRNLSENECWLECNGKSISKTEYPDLFDALRTDDVPLKWNPFCIFYDNDYLIMKKIFYRFIQKKIQMIHGKK